MKKSIFLALSLTLAHLCFGADLAELERACKAKNSNACVSIANRYFNAQGVAKDYKKAQSYLIKACDLDNIEACRKLGIVYPLSNNYTKESYSMAKKYYGKACILSKHQYPCDEYRQIAEYDTTIYEIDKQICDSKGFSRALIALVCFNIGRDYEKQKNNTHQAKIYYTKACNVWNKDACALIGFIYMDERNFHQAKIHFEKACNLGQVNACNSLGIMYKSGTGVQKDIDKAKFYYQQACKRGDKDSCIKGFD